MRYSVRGMEDLLIEFPSVTSCKSGFVVCWNWRQTESWDDETVI
jgi:hypothetical protein